MAAQSERVLADVELSRTQPIELVTENGYSIIRSCEINDEPPPTQGTYSFVVRSPDGLQRAVIVEITTKLVRAIEIHTGGRILLSNSFWIWCAERHLALHLWEHDECPRDGKLRIEVLAPADLNLSIRWERT
jgi:hypothetical protein